MTCRGCLRGKLTRQANDDETEVEAGGALRARGRLAFPVEMGGERGRLSEVRHTSQHCRLATSSSDVADAPFAELRRCEQDELAAAEEDAELLMHLLHSLSNLHRVNTQKVRSKVAGDPLRQRVQPRLLAA